MIQNSITVLPFSQQRFIEAVADASGSTGDPAPQVTYLARYAEQLEAKTIVRESRYVDRHYIDEYALYYSRMLQPPRNSVERFHLFRGGFGEQEFAEWLTQGLASEPERLAVQAKLPFYLGYCCVRPIASVPIGRTVLAQLSDAGAKQRQIWSTTRHTVHLANLELHVEGLSFQQQDAAVGACATAALWSALSRVARQDGMRAPTPAELAELVGRPARSPGRGPIPPSVGLSVQQLCDTTRACGFTPEVIQADERPEHFAASLHGYLLSGIPVVLALRGSGRGHAVTAVGFQLSPSPHPLLEMSIPVRSSRLRKLYVHDDRLGPYARAEIEPFAEQGFGEGLTFQIEMENGQLEDWLLDAAVAPVYPKVRLSMRGLLLLAEHLADVVESMVGADKAFDLGVDVRFVRAGDYLAQLAGQVDPARGAALVREVVLSRWCAIVRWYLQEVPIVDFVFDTTDIRRGDGGELLRAIVGLDSRFTSDVQTLAARYGVPCC